jgi:hypothetical protein
VHLQERVIERVHVLEVVCRGTVLVLRVNAHVVVQNTVHADVVKPDLALHGGKLLLPVSAQTFVGAASSDHAQWHGGMRADDLRDISVDGA